MAVAQGTDTITTIARPIVLRQFVDGVYGSIPVAWRLNKANKKNYSGGRHIEFPFIHSKWNVGGEYDGFDVLDLSPQDNIISGALDKKQYYTAISLSARQISDANTTDAIANLIVTQTEQAKLGFADKIATDLWGSAVSNPKKIDGLRDIVDDGSNTPTYGGLSRSSYPILQSYVDATTTTLSISLIHSLLSRATRGAYSPTLIASRREQYDRAWVLAMSYFQITGGMVLRDEQLASVGFTNIIFDGVPWVVDDKVFDGPNSSNSAIVALNENFLEIALFYNRDFRVEPFRVHQEQDAVSSRVFWMGNLVGSAPFTCAKATNVSA